jgi:hypothetical protein
MLMRYLGAVLWGDPLDRPEAVIKEDRPAGPEPFLGLATEKRRYSLSDHAGTSP